MAEWLQALAVETAFQDWNPSLATQWLCSLGQITDHKIIWYLSFPIYKTAGKKKGSFKI